MEVTIKINGQALSVNLSIEVYEYLDRADHKKVYHIISTKTDVCYTD